MTVGRSNPATTTVAVKGPAGRCTTTCTVSPRRSRCSRARSSGHVATGAPFMRSSRSPLCRPAAPQMLAGLETAIRTLPSPGSHPQIRKSGDEGRPAVLEGESSPHAKALFDFAHRVEERIEQIKAAAPEGVIQIQ